MAHCKECGKAIDDDDNYCPGCGEKLPKSGCFIATACYGKNNNEVQIFRNWRDNTLLKTRSGKQFVNFYYKLSPPIAHFISDKPILKNMVRASLWPIKEIVK